MNDTLKYILILGGSTAAIVGLLVWLEKRKAYKEPDVVDETDEVEGEPENRHGYLNPDAFPQKEQQRDAIVEHKKADNNKTDYTKMINNALTYPTDLAVRKINEKTAEKLKEEEPMEIIEITGDEFIKPDGCEKYTCTYFVADNILAGPDDKLEPMERDTTVGDDILKQFDELRADGQMVTAKYVRNVTTSCDYEILRSDDYYDSAYSELQALISEAGYEDV